MNRFFSVFWKLALAALVLVVGVLAYFDSKVSASFLNHRWEVPAKVYARPLELYPGLPLQVDELDHELELLGYRTVAGVRGRGGRSGTVSGVRASGQKFRSGNWLEFHTRGFEFSDETVEAQRVELAFSADGIQSMWVDGRPGDLVRLEPVQIGGIYPRHREDRLLLRLEEVPSTMVETLLAVEDRGFYNHWGMSPTGILRAAISNLEAGRVVQGGSTITQQLVKNYYLTDERSYWRKLVEVLMALMLELRFDKDEILQGYINEVYLGQDGPRAVHGFGLATRHYFDAPLEELGLHQQALLVGMVKGPSLYNPLRHPERAIQRRNTVIDVMEGQGIINEVEARVARALPLDLSQRPRVINSYPAFLDLVRRQLGRDYREEDLGSLGLSIFTTLDPLLQRQAEISVRKVMDRIDRDGDLQAAMVVTSFDSGEVKALIGGRRPRFSGFNRALDAVRPVGSLIKPVVYLAALQQPGQWTLATPLDDTPVIIESPGQPDWQPRNFDRQSHGSVLLHRALAQSYNQATARLGVAVGIDRVRDVLRKLGVERPQPEVPAMLLGAGGYTPLDVARIYQTIAAGGFRLPLHTIRDVVDAKGRVLQRFPLEFDRVVSLQSMHLLHYALREAMEEGTGKLAYYHLPRDFAVAGKTGTTNDNRDSWFAGFSGDLLAVNWVGHDDNLATRLTGSSGALRVWADFMASASRTSLYYRVPDGIDHYWIDGQTGYLSSERCEGARLMPFVPGSQPVQRNVCTKKRSDIIEWFRRLF